MLISHYVHNVHDDLVRLGQLGGTELADAADRLGDALAPALGGQLLDVLNQLIAEANLDMPNLLLELRLAGDDVRIVRNEPQEEPVESPGEFTARFALRLPEELKALVEERATVAGASANSWIVRALSRELSDSSIRAAQGKGRHMRGTGRS